jgi:hypothetical protein
LLSVDCGASTVANSGSLSAHGPQRLASGGLHTEPAWVR